MSAGRDSISRNTAFAFAAQLTSAAFTAGITLYLVRALGPSGYGVFALAVAIGAMVVLLADLGVTQSAERFIAERRSQPGAVTSVLGDALRLKLIAATVACGALFALAGPIADAYGEGDLAWPLRAVAVAVFGQSLLFLYRGTFVALGRVSLTWRLMTLESAVEAAATIVLVATGAGAAGAAWGRAAGYGFGALLGAIMALRLVGRPQPAATGTGAGNRSRIARYAGALFLVSVAFVAFEQVDVLLIGAILSTTSVAIFEAPMRLSAFLGYAGQALAFGVAPRLSRGGEQRPNVAAFESALRYLVLVQAGLLAPVLVWADPIVDLLLGSEYAKSAPVLRALAPFVFLSAIGTFVTLAVNYIGEARSRVPFAVGAALVNLAIDAILIPDIGVIGGAVGTDVAFALYVLAHLWICRHLLGFSPRPLIGTFVRALVAAAAMAAVLGAFGTSHLSTLEAVCGALGGAAVYCVVLLAAGAVSRSEIAALGRRLTRTA
jgi:O-antigen/teichoic acid export membrane protein